MRIKVIQKVTSLYLFRQIENLRFNYIFLFAALCLLGCKKDKHLDTTDDRPSVGIITEPDETAYYDGTAPTFEHINVYNHSLLLPGYTSFRIPALTVTKQGTMLAFAEMRTLGDLDPKTLVVRRSSDNGKTWGDIRLLEEQTLTKVYGNPIVVSNQQTGRIHLVYLEVLGSQNCNMYHRYSDDDGLTWSQREEIPNLAGSSWRPLGPGAGIQLTRGRYAGRILLPGRYSGGAYAIYSDDDGQTWKLGYKMANIAGSGLSSNETACVELAKMTGEDANIYVNNRNEANTINVYRRLDAYSDDSGQSLTGPFVRNNFIKTVRCEGALLRWSAIDQGGKQNRILFSSLTWAKEQDDGSAQSKRRHVGIWSTFDETQTWTASAKRVQDLKGGYSSMAKAKDGTMSILFEEGETDYYNEISLVRVNEAYLDVPVIGAKWTFEDLTPGSSVSAGSTLAETYKGGTKRNIRVAGSISVIEGSAVYKQKTALNFNGSAYLKLDDPETWTQFDFDENQSFTVEMVVKAGKAGFLAGRPYSAGWPQWLLQLESDGCISFRMDDDEQFVFLKSTAGIADNKWHHIAAVRDRSNKKLRIYIDGSLSAETTDIVKGSLANRRPFYIGGRESGSNFAGGIDFVRITPDALNSFFVN